MPGPDTVAEEAPVLVGFGLALLSLLMWIALRGVRGIWSYTLGALFLALAAINFGKGRISLGHPLGILAKWNADILNALALAADTYESAMGFWFHSAARLQLWMVEETWKGAKAALHFGEWVVHTYGPLAVKTATTVLFPWPKIYRYVHSEIAKALPKIGKVTHDLSFKSALQAAELAALWAAFGAIAGTIGHGGRVGSLPHGVGIPKAWTKWRTRVDRRLTKVEAFAAAGVFAGLLANTLGVSKRCVRSGNVGKAARHLCGLDSSFLNALLGLGVAVGGAISIVELAEANQKILPGVIDGLGFLIEETPDAFREIGHDVLAEAAALIPGI